MSKDIWFSLEVAVATAAIIASAALVFVTRDSISVAEIDQLQRQAAKSCNCERTGGKGCFDDFRKRVERRGGQTMSSACAPISTEIACFGSKQPCILMKYMYVGDRHLTLCDAHDAQAIDHAYNATFAKTGDDRAAGAEMDRVVAAIIRGERVQIASADPGCAG